MIEWGNNWARAINYRKHNNEAFAGFFSQIGRLYNVHHIWCKFNRYSFLLLKSIRITFVFTNNKFMFLVVNRLQISARPQGDQGSRLAIPRMGRVCGLYGPLNP